MNQPESHSTDDLLAPLRQVPPEVDPARVLGGLEARVIARLRESRRDDATPLWFWRWSILFASSSVACMAICGYNWLHLTSEALAALDQGAWLVSLGF